MRFKVNNNLINMMRLFVKIYADDFKSASSTFPLTFKGTPEELTIHDLKVEIEKQIEPKTRVRNQILSIKKNAVIVRLYFACEYR